VALTAPFATDSDLVTFMPDMLTFGVGSFIPQNMMASDDVFERLNAEWWPQAIGGFYGLAQATVDVTWPVLPVMQEARLNVAALKNLTAYRAISHYIMPLLSSDADANGDLFTRRADRYNSFYHEEWEKVTNLPLYDFNADNRFSNIERMLPTGRRLMRA